MKHFNALHWQNFFSPVRRILSKKQFVAACFGAAAITLLPSTSAIAAGNELFTAMPANVAVDANSAQAQRLAQIKKEATTGSVSLVKIDVSALSNSSTHIALAADKAFDFAKTHVEQRDSNSFTWFGTLPGVKGKAVLVVNHGNITGTIHDEGQLYRVEPVGNGVHALIKVDASHFPPDHPASFKEKEKHPGALPKASQHSAEKLDGITDIDVLVAYTPSARGAVSDMAATIQLAIAEANQSYTNSGVNIRLNLVDSLEVNYSESGKTFDGVMTDFTAMNDIKARRDASAADMAVMIINKADYCGLANAIMANATNAYALVHYSCATGYYSFVHELGHLQGARHDPANDGSTTPYAYGHGYQYGNSWRTIMAYNCASNCPRLQYWSNPNVNYNGVAMGTPSVSNNARVLNETAATVAAFRSRGAQTFCANENGVCRFSGVRSVTYGANGHFVTKIANGSINCNNATFGDPIVGTVKSCSYSADTFTYCANENGRCNFTGSKTVAYGANSSFTSRVLSNGTDCTNGVFGDPLFNTVKACYIK